MDEPIWVGNTIMSRGDLVVLVIVAMLAVAAIVAAIGVSIELVWKWLRPTGGK